MTVYLASDFGKLILGYLESRGFTKSAEIMLEEFPELQEVALQRKKGHKVNLRIEGYTLLKMLNDFSHTKELVIENVEKYPSKFSSVKTILSLHEQVQTIINIAISNPIYNFPKKQPKKLGFPVEQDPELICSTSNISVSVGGCKSFSQEGSVVKRSDTDELLFTVNNNALGNYQLEHCISDNTVSDQNIGVEEGERLQAGDSNIILNDFSVADDTDNISPAKRKGSVRKKTTSSPTNKTLLGLESSQKKFLDTLMSDSTLHAKWADTINKRLENYSSHRNNPQTQFTIFENINQPALISASTNTSFCNNNENFSLDTKSETSKTCLGLSDNNIRDLCMEFTNDLLMLPNDGLKNSSQSLPLPLTSTNNLGLDTSNPDLESQFASSRNLTTPVPQLSPSNNSFLSSSTMFNTFSNLDEVHPSNSSGLGNMTFFEHCLPSDFKKSNIPTNIPSSSVNMNCNVEHSVLDTKNVNGQKQSISFSKPDGKVNDSDTNADNSFVEKPANSEYSTSVEKNVDLIYNNSSALVDKECVQSTRMEKCCETQVLSNSTITEDILDSSSKDKQTKNVVESENTENDNHQGGSYTFGSQNDFAKNNTEYNSEKYMNSKPNEIKSSQNGEDFAGVNQQNAINSSIPITYSPSYPAPATAIQVTDSHLPKSVYFSGTPDHASNYTFEELTPLSPFGRSENLIQESPVASHLSKLTKVEILGPSQKESNSISTAIVHTAMGESIITKIPSPDKNPSCTTITVIPINVQNHNFQPIIPKLISKPSRDIAEELDELKEVRRRLKKDNSCKNNSKIRKKKKVNFKSGSKKPQYSLKPIIPHGPNNILMEDDNQVGGTMVCNIAAMGKKYTLPNCVSVSVPNMPFNESHENNSIHSTHLSPQNSPRSLKSRLTLPESKEQKILQGKIPSIVNRLDRSSKNVKKKKIKGKIKTTEMKLLDYAIETALKISSQKTPFKENEYALDVKQLNINNISNIESNNLNNNDKKSDHLEKSKHSTDAIDSNQEKEICVAKDMESIVSSNFTRDGTESFENRVSVSINPQMEFLVDKIEMGLIDEVLDSCGEIEYVENDKNGNNNCQDGNLPNGSQLQSLLSFSKSFTLSNIQKQFESSRNISPSLFNRNHKGSFSTPRNKAHIRALDFGTPRKAFSSKKSARKVKASLTFSSPSPIKKLSIKNLKSQCKSNSLRKCHMESIEEEHLDKSYTPTTEIELGNNDLCSLSQDLALSDESNSLTEKAYLPLKNLSLISLQTPGKFPVCLEPSTPFLQAISSNNPISCDSNLNTPAPPFIATPGKSSLLKAYPQGPYSDSSEGTYYQPSERSVDMSDRSLIESEDFCSKLGDDLERILIQTAQKSEEELKSSHKVKDLDTSPHFSINCDMDDKKKSNGPNNVKENDDYIKSTVLEERKSSNLCGSSIVVEAISNSESAAQTREIANNPTLTLSRDIKTTSSETTEMIKTVRKIDKKTNKYTKRSSNSASTLNPLDKLSNEIVIKAKSNLIKRGKGKKCVRKNIPHKKIGNSCKEVKNTKKITKTRSSSKLSENKSQIYNKKKDSTKSTVMVDRKLSKLKTGIKRKSSRKTVNSCLQPMKNNLIQLPGLTIEHIPSMEQTIKSQIQIDNNLLPPVSESLIKGILNEEFKNKELKYNDKVRKRSRKKVFKNWGKQILHDKSNSSFKDGLSSSDQLSKWYGRTKDLSLSEIQQKGASRAVPLPLNELSPKCGMLTENKSIHASKLKSRSDKICFNDATDLSTALNNYDDSQATTINKTPLNNSRTITSGEEYMEIERQLEALDGKVFDSPAIREGLRNQDSEINLAEIFTPPIDTNKKEINFTPRKGDLHRSVSSTMRISFDSHSKSSMMHFTPLPQTPEKEVEEFCQSVVKDRIGLVAFPSSSRVLNFEKWDCSDFKNRGGGGLGRDTKGNLRSNYESIIRNKPNPIKVNKSSHNGSFITNICKVSSTTDDVSQGCELGNNNDSRLNANFSHAGSCLKGDYSANQLSLSHYTNRVSLSQKVSVGESDHVKENFNGLHPNNEQRVSDESDEDSNDFIPITLLFSPFIDLLSLNLPAVESNDQMTHKHECSNNSKFLESPTASKKVIELQNEVHNLQRNILVRSQNLENSAESLRLENSAESSKCALITDIIRKDTETIGVKRGKTNKFENKFIELKNLRQKKERKSETEKKKKDSTVEEPKDVSMQVNRKGSKRKICDEEPSEPSDPRLKDKVLRKNKNDSQNKSEFPRVSRDRENCPKINENNKKITVNMIPKAGGQQRNSPKKDVKIIEDSKKNIECCNKIKPVRLKKDPRKPKLCPIVSTKKKVQLSSSKHNRYLSVPETPEKCSASSTVDWNNSVKHSHPTKSVLSFTDLVTFEDDNTSICTIPPTPGKDLFNFLSSELIDTGSEPLKNEVPCSDSVSPGMTSEPSSIDFKIDGRKEDANVDNNKDCHKLIGKINHRQAGCTDYNSKTKFDLKTSMNPTSCVSIEPQESTNNLRRSERKKNQQRSIEKSTSLEI